MFAAGTLVNHVFAYKDTHWRLAVRSRHDSTPPTSNFFHLDLTCHLHPQGMIGMSVQVFFSWRIKVLTGSIWAALFVGFFGVVQFCTLSALFPSCSTSLTMWIVAGLATSIAVGIIPHFLDFQIFKPAVVVWLAGSAFCDSMITIVLVTYLVSRQCRVPSNR